MKWSIEVNALLAQMLPVSPTSAPLSCHQSSSRTVQSSQLKRIKYLMVVVLCVVKNSASLFSLCWGRGWLGSHVDLTLYC